MSNVVFIEIVENIIFPNLKIKCYYVQLKVLIMYSDKNINPGYWHFTPPLNVKLLFI